MTQKQQNHSAQAVTSQPNLLALLSGANQFGPSDIVKNMKTKRMCFFKGVAVLAMALGNAQGASFTNLLSIDFESSEGYTNGHSLYGQSHWVMAPGQTNGSGIASKWPGLGQQAFLGLVPLTFPNDNLLTGYPLSYTPGSRPYVSFSLVLSISASMHGGTDDFGWLFLNTDSTELLAVDFFNTQKVVGFETNHGQVNTIEAGFTNGTLYRLEIDMDFVHDTWAATLGGHAVTPGPLPIGAPGDTMNFTGPLATWVYESQFNPGNNAMYFDRIRVVAGDVPPTLPPPALSISPGSNPSTLAISISTEPGMPYYLESSSDLQHWNLVTNTFSTNLIWNVSDAMVPGLGQKFYRARAAVMQ